MLDDGFKCDERDFKECFLKVKKYQYLIKFISDADISFIVKFLLVGEICLDDFSS